MPVPRDAKLKDAKDTRGLQGMSEAHQIKIFSGEILTFLKPASPGAWLASASNSGLRAPTPCNLPVQAEIFISGIIRGQGEAIHRRGVSCKQIAGGSFGHHTTDAA